MRDSYVNNVEEILIANETQKAKIEFLEREKAKRDHYLADLQENLKLNKQTLLELNSLGPNLTAVNHLLRQGEELEARLKAYYEEYQSINAVLLMEKQMRLEDKHFYNERIIEFENKIIDLRKYLHDKEDSFSSVVIRLKRYEELSELPLDDKLAQFKKEIGEKHLNEFITDLLREKNTLKQECQVMRKQFKAFHLAKVSIIQQHPDTAELIAEYEENCRALPIAEKTVKNEEEKKKTKVDPNRELIRLLKKEKLNNELLEEALNEAIEKNEELVSIKETLERSLTHLERKYELLHAENTIIAMRLGEYDRHFCRQHLHSVKFYEEGDQIGLRHMLQPRLKEYAKHASLYYEQQQLRSKYIAKLKADVEQWGEFLCESDAIRKETVKRGLLTKSCSVPTLVVGFDVESEQMQESERLEIVEF